MIGQIVYPKDNAFSEALDGGDDNNNLYNKPVKILSEPYKHKWNSIFANELSVYEFIDIEYKDKKYRVLNDYSQEPIVDKIDVFIKRLKKINIDVKLISNYPWLYLDSINGKRVDEKFYAEHGFTIAFQPIRKDQELEFLDIKKLFELIRKYMVMSHFNSSCD